MKFSTIAKSYLLLLPRALPAFVTIAALLGILFWAPRIPRKFKRCILAALPVLAVIFVFSAKIFPRIFTLMPEPHHPWYTKFTSPFWLVCMIFVSFPNFLLVPFRGAFGSVSMPFGIFLSIVWIVGLTLLLWRLGGRWFGNPQDQ